MLESETKMDIHDFPEPPPGMDPVCEKVEGIAREVWTDVADAATHRIHLGEESITDRIALQLARAASKLPSRLQFRTYQLTRAEEHACGADWEWFIGNKRRGWHRFLVQAKKLDPATGRYPELQRADRRERQIAALRAAAAAATKDLDEARPTLFYAFYNGMPSRNANAQFGVAVLPLDAIAKLAPAQGFTFDAMRVAGALPWRVLVCPEAQPSFALAEPARELPPRIREGSTTVARKRQGADVPKSGSERPTFARYTVAIEIGTVANDVQPMGEGLAFL